MVKFGYTFVRFYSGERILKMVKNYVIYHQIYTMTIRLSAYMEEKMKELQARTRRPAQQATSRTRSTRNSSRYCRVAFWDACLGLRTLY